MIPDQPVQGTPIIVYSFIIALMLTVMPLPEWAINWRPAWIPLVLIYWCMAVPHRVGVATAWFMGLILDVQQGSLLGLNAISLSLIAFVTIKMHQRIRVYPLTQQALVIGFYLLFYLLLVMIIRGMIGIAPSHWTYWMPAITSMFLWPWVFIIMRDVRRRYKIS